MGAPSSDIDFFLRRTDRRVLIDQLQSEQGLFFRRKRNRNIVVETTADVPLRRFSMVDPGQING
jgi:oxidase EvaA